MKDLSQNLSADKSQELTGKNISSATINALGFEYSYKVTKDISHFPIMNSINYYIVNDWYPDALIIDTIDKGANVNQIHDSGMSALYMAAHKKMYNVMEKLMRKGADILAPITDINLVPIRFEPDIIEFDQQTMKLSPAMYLTYEWLDRTIKWATEQKSFNSEDKTLLNELWRGVKFLKQKGIKLLSENFYTNQSQKEVVECSYNTLKLVVEKIQETGKNFCNNWVEESKYLNPDVEINLIESISLKRSDACSKKLEIVNIPIDNLLHEESPTSCITEFSKDIMQEQQPIVILDYAGISDCEANIDSPDGEMQLMGNIAS